MPGKPDAIEPIDAGFDDAVGAAAGIEDMPQAGIDKLPFAKWRGGSTPVTMNPIATFPVPESVLFHPIRPQRLLRM